MLNLVFPETLSINFVTLVSCSVWTIMCIFKHYVNYKLVLLVVLPFNKHKIANQKREGEYWHHPFPLGPKGWALWLVRLNSGSSPLASLVPFLSFPPDCPLSRRPPALLSVQSLPGQVEAP